MYQIGRFTFESRETAKQAKREADGIRYIRSKTDLDDPDVVLKLYQRLIEQNVFETPVGMMFLCELQQYLQMIPYIKNEDIPLIPINAVSEKPKSQPYAIATGKNYQTKFRVMIFVCSMMAVMIAGMFAITFFAGENANILNYENEIIDKYEAWEQELSEREADIEKREALLEQQVR